MDAALYMASYHNQCECLELLLNHGSQPNYIGPFGLTALMHVSFKACFPCIQLLLSHNADVHAQTANWENVFQWIASSRELYPKIIRTLHSGGANINNSILEGYTSADPSATDPSATGHSPTDPSPAAPSAGITALMRAATNIGTAYYIQNLQTMLELGARVECPDPRGYLKAQLSLFDFTLGEEQYDDLTEQKLTYARKLLFAAGYLCDTPNAGMGAIIFIRWGEPSVFDGCSAFSFGPPLCMHKESLSPPFAKRNKIWSPH